MCEDIEMIPGRMGRPPARKTCRECPLRKDANRGALGGWTPMMYLRGLFGPADIACHLSSGFKDGERERQKSCTGVAAFRANVSGWEASSGVHPLSHAKEAVDAIAGEAETRAECFSDPNEFLAHHDVPEGAAQNWMVLPKGRDPNKPCGA